MNLILPIAAAAAAFLLLREKRPGFTVPPAGAIPPSGGTSSGGTSSASDRELVRGLQSDLNRYHFALCRQENPPLGPVVCNPGPVLAVDGLFGPLTAASLARVFIDLQQRGAPSADSWRRLSSSERTQIARAVQEAADEIASATVDRRRAIVARRPR